MHNELFVQYSNSLQADYIWKETLMIGVKKGLGEHICLWKCAVGKQKLMWNLGAAEIVNDTDFVLFHKVTIL